MVQLALISPALGELAGCGFFPKGARNNPVKRSVCHMFSNSLLASAGQLGLFPGPESQGCLQGVWLEHCATPSLSLPGPEL